MAHPWTSMRLDVLLGVISDAAGNATWKSSLIMY